MKLDKIVGQFSALIAGVVTFVFVFGMYLSMKGFEFLPDGRLVLVKEANASENKPKAIDANLVLPTGFVMGDKNAKASIYEFSSFNCFHCAKFHLNILPEIKKEFIDTGKANLVFVSFPLDAKSMQGALVASCLPENKRFAFINKVFENQRKWGISSKTGEYFQKYALEYGMSEKDFNQCLKDEKKASDILANRQDAMKNFNIEGTPSFLIVKGKERFMFEGIPSLKNLSEILNKN
ncbi:MAG: thioredoxin domain-containing protein [Alphaproteobacteria bacterium]